MALLTLFEHGTPTLGLVPPLLNDDHFRGYFTAGLRDVAGRHGYWQWYDSVPPPLRAQVVGPVLARLRQFLLRDFVKDTVGVAGSSFDMGEVLDGGLLLVRLPKGILGEETTKVLGSLVVAKVWQAATARASLPEHERRDATMYVDECHNFLNLPSSVADMLAEARGYRLGLVLAHQHLDQLPKDVRTTCRQPRTDRAARRRRGGCGRVRRANAKGRAATRGGAAPLTRPARHRRRTHPARARPADRGITRLQCRSDPSG